MTKDLPGWIREGARRRNQIRESPGVWGLVRRDLRCGGNVIGMGLAGSPKVGIAKAIVLSIKADEERHDGEEARKAKGSATRKICGIFGLSIDQLDALFYTNFTMTALRIADLLEEGTFPFETESQTA